MDSQFVTDQEGTAVGRGGHAAPTHCLHAGVVRARRMCDDGGMAMGWCWGEWEEVGDARCAGSSLDRVV